MYLRGTKGNRLHRSGIYRQRQRKTDQALFAYSMLYCDMVWELLPFGLGVHFLSLALSAGDEKGAVLDDLILTLPRAPPRVVVEFGCYVGYSCTRMSRLRREKTP
eukprot:2485476-Amphidinium_carterae.1